MDDEQWWEGTVGGERVWDWLSETPFGRLMRNRKSGATRLIHDGLLPRRIGLRGKHRGQS